jgi:hypothetical protein
MPSGPVRRRRALILLAAVLAAGAAAAARGATTHSGRAIPARPASAHLLPLLPLARGQLIVSLGAPPQWLPVAGRPLTVTLFSGRPALRRPAGVNAYISFQRTGRRCPASPAADRRNELVIPGYYARSHLVTATSSFAPGGGARAGDYEYGIPGVTVHQSGATRACVWLASKPTQHTRAHVQDIPLLNGLFAASVSNVPSDAPRSGTVYNVSAVDVARRFRYAISTENCGTTYHDGPHTVADGTIATAAITFGKVPCEGDGSTFTFTATSGRSLGTLTYTAADAVAVPAAVAVLGGCELDPVTVTTLADAEQYLAADGCQIGRVLVAPFQRGIRRGAVVEAQVDGGIASVAPRGTKVDLVLNGRP